MLKFIEWLQCHDLFSEMSSLMSISTGIIADDSINCHKAFEKGMKTIEGKNFKELQLSRKNRVVPLGAVKTTAKINGESAPISPDTIFRRIPFHIKSQLQLESHFRFELDPYPLPHIIHKYVYYMKSKYKYDSITLVFDGYPEDVAEKSFKSSERARGAHAMSSSSVIFQEHTKAAMPKDRLLLNDHNKKRLISMLTNGWMREFTGNKAWKI